jgi:diguanylate cyclase (GGDEF)-like protein
MYNSRRQMVTGILIALVLLGLPAFISPTSPMSIVGGALIPGVLLTVIGVTVHTLMERNRRATTRINQLAHTDSLTGLPNRRGWDAELPRALARAARESRPLTVMLGDFNEFKRFNDRFGHQAGDALLKKATEEWRAALRAVDFLSRWGGDEFALILPNCPALFARDVVTRLNEVTPYGQEASFGVVTWDGRGSSEDLMQSADSSLYAIKQRRSQSRLASERAAAVARATRGIHMSDVPGAG